MAKMVLWSAMKGRVLMNGRPAAGAVLVRNYSWHWKNEKGSDRTTADTNGDFTFPAIEGSIYEFHDLGPEYTQLIDQGSKETDLTKRQAIYSQAAHIMYDDPPMPYLIIPQDIYGANKKVQGFQPRTDQVLWLFPANIA